MSNFVNNITNVTEIVNELRINPQNITNYDIESDAGIKLLKAAAAANKKVLTYLPEYVTNDEYIMLSVISAVPQAIANCSSELRFDRSFMFRAIDANPLSYIYAPCWVRSDKELSIEAIRAQHNMFDFTSSELKEDMEFALACLKADYRLYPTFFFKRGFTDEEREYLFQNEGRLGGFMLDLLEDKETVLRLVSKNPFIAKFIPKRFAEDRDFIDELLSKNGLAFKYLSNEIKDDGELAMRLFKDTPMAFLAVSERLKSDKDFVLEAVRENWYILKYTDYFKNDEDVVMEAVSGNPKAALHIGSTLNMNSEFMAELVLEYPAAARFLCRKPCEHFPISA